MPDRKTDELPRQRVKRLLATVMDAKSPENFDLPSYVNVDAHTSSSEEPSHEKVQKRKRLKYVDDWAEVARTDEDSSSVESGRYAIAHSSIRLSSSSSSE